MKRASMEGFRAVALLALASCACGAEPGASESSVANGSELITVPVPNDWVGREVGVSPPRLRALGQLRDYIPLRAGQLGEDLRSAERAEARPSESETIMATGPDGSLYEVVSAPEEIELVATRMRELGWDGASQALPADFNTLGWSAGNDTRVRFPDRPGSGDFPRDTIGQVGRGADYIDCSGVLFDDRLVLTAFHCLWAGPGMWADALTFTPGRDDSNVPYTTVNHVWSYWPKAYLDDDCNKTFSRECSGNDWAVLVLEEAPMSAYGAPGFMGFALDDDGQTVQGWDKYHRGYPGCDDVTDPLAQCDSATHRFSQWGNIESCPSLIIPFPFQPSFPLGCDLGKGDSGSPVFSTAPGSTGPYIIGLVSAEACSSTECKRDDVFPNIAYRLSKKVYQDLAYFRSIY